MTSQIFANIYLNEFDRLIKHSLKPQAYLRYGDDFIIIDSKIDILKLKISTATKFLTNNLKLQIHPQRNIILKPKQGLKFLGVKMWPNGRALSKRNLNRVKDRLTLQNVASYHGLITKHETPRKRKELDWLISEQLI